MRSEEALANDTFHTIWPLFLSPSPSGHKGHEHFFADCFVWMTVWSRTPCKVHLCESNSVLVREQKKQQKFAARTREAVEDILLFALQGNPLSNSKKKRQEAGGKKTSL